MSIKVLGARCLVKENKMQDDKTTSGIIIPGRSKEPTYEGTVIAVGSGSILENGTRVPMEVEAGDNVIYTSFAGTPIKHGEDVYLVLNERDVICVIE